MLSPGNPAIDTETKRRAYARAGVPECWIVRPAARDVLVYSAPDGVLGAYTGSVRVAPDGDLMSPTLPVRVSVDRFVAGAPGTAV